MNKRKTTSSLLAPLWIGPQEDMCNKCTVRGRRGIGGMLERRSLRTVQRVKTSCGNITGVGTTGMSSVIQLVQEMGGDSDMEKRHVRSAKTVDNLRRRHETRGKVAAPVHRRVRNNPKGGLKACVGRENVNFSAEIGEL